MFEAEYLGMRLSNSVHVHSTRAVCGFKNVTTHHICPTGSSDSDKGVWGRQLSRQKAENKWYNGTIFELWDHSNINYSSLHYRQQESREHELHCMDGVSVTMVNTCLMIFGPLKYLFPSQINLKSDRNPYPLKQMDLGKTSNFRGVHIIYLSSKGSKNMSLHF